MKANLQSPCLIVLLLCMARSVRSRTVGIDTTGEKQSDFVQGLRSKLPRTTMQLLALVGTPLVHLMVKVHMDGIAFILCNLHSRMYSASLMMSNVS